MSEIQINTTQNVNISFTAASVGERILAYMVDMVIKIAYGVVVYQLLFKLFNFNDVLQDMDQWSQIAVLLIFYIPVMFYSLAFESLLEGQTIGKRLLKIRVVKIDGYQASFADYMVRWFFRIIDINMLSGIIALISIIVSPKNQRIGDLTAGTSVISLRNTITIKHTILEELKDDYTPVYPNVIKLSDNDVRIIKETFVAARKSGDHTTLLKLKRKVEEVIETQSKHNDTFTFLDTILKDYNYYTKNG